MEDQLKSMHNEKSMELKTKIEKQKELIRIWNKNIEEIKKQLKNLT